MLPLKQQITRLAQARDEIFGLPFRLLPIVEVLFLALALEQVRNPDQADPCSATGVNAAPTSTSPIMGVCNPSPVPAVKRFSNACVTCKPRPSDSAVNSTRRPVPASARLPPSPRAPTGLLHFSSKEGCAVSTHITTGRGNCWRGRPPEESVTTSSMPRTAKPFRRGRVEFNLVELRVQGVERTVQRVRRCFEEQVESDERSFGPIFLVALSETSVAGGEPPGVGATSSGRDRNPIPRSNAAEYNLESTPKKTTGIKCNSCLPTRAFYIRGP